MRLNFHLLVSGLDSVIYGEPTKLSLKFIRNKIHPTGLQCNNSATKSLLLHPRTRVILSLVKVDVERSILFRITSKEQLCKSIMYSVLKEEAMAPTHEESFSLFTKDKSNFTCFLHKIILCRHSCGKRRYQYCSEDRSYEIGDAATTVSQVEEMATLE